MGTVADVLRVARSQIGYNRWDDPEPGTRFGRWYSQITGSPYFGTNGVPYCAMFVSWVLAHAGVQCEGFPRAVAIDRRDGFSRQVEPYDLKAGDVTGFDWDVDHKGDHVGIVESHEGGVVTIATIEGNTGNSEVKRCQRFVSQCTIGVRPYYDGSSNPADDASMLDIDGACGPKTVAVWQAQMGTPEDAVISGQLHSEDYYRPNVWALNYTSEGRGSALILKAQRFLKAKGRYDGTMDGCWGGRFSYGLQRYLSDLGYYDGKLDKVAGHHTIKALQQSLNDGKWK